MNSRINAPGDPEERKPTKTMPRGPTAQRMNLINVSHAEARIMAAVTALSEAELLLGGVPKGPCLAAVQRSRAEAVKARELATQLIKRIP